MRDLKKGFVKGTNMDFMSIKMNYTNEVILVEISLEDYSRAWDSDVFVCLIPGLYVGMTSPASGPAVLH
jgi:hypothetical protein